MNKIKYQTNPDAQREKQKKSKIPIKIMLIVCVKTKLQTTCKAESFYIFHIHNKIAATIQTKKF